MKALVVGVKTYSFQNEQGQKIEGARVSYLTNIQSTKSNEVGFLPMQTSVPLNMINQVSVVPGIYDIKFDMVPGRNNKPEVVVSGFEFLNQVDYLGLFENE